MFRNFFPKNEHCQNFDDNKKSSQNQNFMADQLR